MKSYDAIVIGGGPAGLTAALYLLRSGVSTCLVEKLASGGQMLMTEKVENYPGFPDGAFGYELADKMEAQVANWASGTFDRFTEDVITIAPGEKLHTVITAEQELQAKVVLITTGAVYRKLGIPGEEQYSGRGVSYCALCDGNFFRDQVVAVVGGGNSALEESLYLARLVKKLYLIHRREDFRGAKCYQDKCFMHPRIETVRSHVAERITGEREVTGMTLRHVQTGEARDLTLDGVFIFVGFRPVNEFVPAAIEKDERGFVITDTEMRTNIPGIYAAGDIRSKVIRQVATAVGDGATAAGNAITYLENYVP